VKNESAIRFDKNVLDIDCEAVLEQSDVAIREMVGRKLKRRGTVLGVSGGVDSSVCAAMAARALGPKRVWALLMPEQDSSPESTAKGRSLCDAIGVEYVVEDIAPVLESLGCYRRRDEAIQKVFPEFGPGYRQKIAVAGDLLDNDRVNFFNLIVESPDGVQQKKRMPLAVYLQVVAATNMKQRVRKLLEYSYADAKNFAVIGTPNRLEYDQGFFVRGGDGLADLKPIAHLYKTQVYALARHLGLPEEICNQTPSTDTYSLPQTQEEFYFALPYHEMDLLLYAFVHGVSAEQAGKVMDLGPEQVERVYRDIVSKRRTTKQLHAAALLIEEVDIEQGEG
jgi:NAD+ synthase